MRDRAGARLAKGGAQTVKTLQRKPRALVLWRATWPLGWRWIIRGIEYTRCLEYPLVLDAASLEDGMRVLDVGAAPFSILPLYLAASGRYQLHAIDIAPYISKLSTYSYQLAPKTPVRVSRQDARTLGFRSAAFDRVLAVSTLEHIPGPGDTSAIREIARVLAPGGRAIVSVPYAPLARDEYTDETAATPIEVDAGLKALIRRSTGRQVFFQRRYDDSSVIERLIVPSGLRLAEMRFFGEFPLAIRYWWWKRPPAVKVLTNWVSPILAGLFLRPLPAELRRHAEALVIALVKD